MKTITHDAAKVALIAYSAARGQYVAAIDEAGEITYSPARERARRFSEDDRAFLERRGLEVRSITAQPRRRAGGRIAR
jgi:hypothetical protein